LANLLKKHAGNLLVVLVVALIVWSFAFRDATLLEGLVRLWNMFLVAFGIGLLIFVHELGHFLAAKLCNVKVETFSVGFGPAVPGCRFQVGETQYKLAWFPLGGYVKMAGEYPSEQSDEALKNDPRAFMNKSVGQRMLIISAGVIMNLIVGMLCFVIVYNLGGKPQVAPAISFVEPGSPAAMAGLEAGSRILAIDGNTTPTFEDLKFAAMLSNPGVTQIAMRWQTPSGQVREGTIVPRRLGDDPHPLIGAGLPLSRRVIEPGQKGVAVAFPGFPAAEAGFAPGDEIVAVRPQGQDAAPIAVTNGWHFTVLEGKFRKEPMVVSVLRGGQTIDLVVPPNFLWTFGFRLEPGPIVQVQDPQLRPSAARDLAVGDVIVGLNGDRSFDALRLPDLLRDLAEAGAAIRLTVQRNGTEFELAIDPAAIRDRGTWEEQTPNNPLSPVGIPALGVAYKVEPVLRGVEPGSPAEKAGLKASDRIKAVTFPDDDIAKRRSYVLGEVQWPPLFFRLQTGKPETVELTIVEAGGSERRLKLTTQQDRSWPFYMRGLRREVERSRLKAETLWQGVVWGLRDTHRNIARLYLSLNSILRGRVSVTESLSGPIGLLGTTYKMAETGYTELIFMIGFISINLAVINFLPIPILDGGHMVFLIIEKLRGKPVSEGVLVIANVVGLMLILSLMVFAVALDLGRFGWLRLFS
jgi:regulator of sigma E protease